MAVEATHLLCPMLLGLLASGSWAQDMELQKLEGTTLSVGCLYSWRQSSAEKIWGRKASVNVYSILATTFWTWDPRYSIQDYPKSNSFVVTITGLRVQDSGFYACGLSEGGQIYVLKTLHLVVSKAPTPPTTRSTQRPTVTTAPASASSPAIDSPPGDWKWKVTGAGVAVTALLLLGCGVLMVLYLRKARGTAGKGNSNPHHTCEDPPAQKEATTDFDQPGFSEPDTDMIHYASLIHLNHCAAEGAVHPHRRAAPKPALDPLPSVEYASIAGHRPQPPAPAALSVEPGN